MDRFTPEYLILHDYGGTPGPNPSFNPYHTLISGGRVIYRNPQNPYGQPAPHAYRMNPRAIGLSWGGPVGGKPSKEEFALLKSEVDKIKQQFPNIKVLSHGEAYQQTRGTGQQASRLGRGLDEAAWRTYLSGDQPYEPGTVTPSGPTPMGQRSLTAYAGVSKTQPPTTGTPQPMPKMLDVGGQAPIMDPSEVARREMLAKSLMQAGQQSAQAPRHWLQALGSVLQTGMGSYQAGQAAQGLAQGQAAGNKALADMLMGGEASAAMANPYSANEALQYQQQQQILKQRADQAERLKRLEIDANRADPLYQARLNKLQAETAALNAKPQVDQQRVQQLETMGMDPNSAEGLAYRANGKLSADAQKMMLQKQQKQQAAPKIAEGLNNLLKMTDQYNDAAFENALGPIQGSKPDGLLSAGWANLARAFGEVMNAVEGGNATPNEVRNNIMGSTEAIAAAIKPLIRAPGEGVWTDADQERLVAIVGDLAQAGSKEEFRRRLNAVRDRISSNFALDVPFNAGAANELPKAQPRSTVQPSVSVPMNRGGAGRAIGQPPVQITSDADYDALPSGSVFIDPNGKTRRKP